MNQQKIRELCAKARGWELGILENVNNPAPVWRRSDGIAVVECSKYNPIDDTEQADALLEYVADGREINIRFWSGWQVVIWQGFGAVSIASAETQNLAKVLCSLRASPEVTAEELEEALK